MLNRQLQIVILVDFYTTMQTLQLDVFVYAHDLIFLNLYNIRRAYARILCFWLGYTWTVGHMADGPE